MQFILYGTSNNPAQGGPMTMEQLAALGQLTEDATKAGILVTTGALNPNGTRLQLAEGKFTVTDGPFIEAKELMGGFAIIRANSMEEAVAWAKRFRSITGDGESEIVQIWTAEDGAG